MSELINTGVLVTNRNFIICPREPHLSVGEGPKLCPENVRMLDGCLLIFSEGVVSLGPVWQSRTNFKGKTCTCICKSRDWRNRLCVRCVLSGRRNREKVMLMLDEIVKYDCLSHPFALIIFLLAAKVRSNVPMVRIQ